MSISSILLLVVVAIVILAILFTFFHFLIALIPVAIIVGLVLWLISYIDRKKHGGQISSNNTFTWFKQNQSNDEPPRKHARNVTTKDVDDKSRN